MKPYQPWMPSIKLTCHESCNIWSNRHGWVGGPARVMVNTGLNGSEMSVFENRDIRGFASSM
jgi:hypothetical protein